MSEKLVFDTATSRLINWVLGVGSVVTGGLLLWIGSTTHELAKGQAVTNERVQAMQAEQATTGRAVDAVTDRLGEVSLKLQRVEDRIEDNEHRED